MKKIHISVKETIQHQFYIDLPDDEADRLLQMEEWSCDLNEILGDIAHSQGGHITICDAEFEDGEVMHAKALED